MSLNAFESLGLVKATQESTYIMGFCPVCVVKFDSDDGCSLDSMVVR